MQQYFILFPRVQVRHKKTDAVGVDEPVLSANYFMFLILYHAFIVRTALSYPLQSEYDVINECKVNTM